MSGSTGRAVLAGLSLALLAACGTCTAGDGLLHQSASFGGDVAGQRGTSEVIFINNTPYRAIFTFGAYDDFDANTEPELISFSPEDDFNLEGGASIGPLSITCSRIYSIGGAAMIRLSVKNLSREALPSDALVPGAYFSDAPLGSDEESEPTEGTAGPLDMLIGLDFPCDSVITIRFEENDVGSDEFRIDYEVIPRAAAPL
jgi:hypothetical protein